MVHYETLLQNAADIITKYNSYFIKKRDKRLLQNELGFLLQNVTVLLATSCNSYANCDVYYKMRWYKLTTDLQTFHNRSATREATFIYRFHYFYHAPFH